MPDSDVAPEIAILLGLLDEGFDRKAWHGPNLRGSLRGLAAAEAARRPGRGRHNVWEVAVHAAYWKYAVRRRLTGEKRGSFRLEGSNWFVRPAPGVRAASLERAWKADLALLADEHRLLREVVARLAASELEERSHGSRQTNLTLVRGVAAHDLYHAGQIQLLKRLVRG
jgi:hypothetical protein